MKKVVICAVSALVMFSGCSKYDGLVNKASEVHQVGKVMYNVGGKGLLTEKVQIKLENASTLANTYGEARKIVRQGLEVKK